MTFANLYHHEINPREDAMHKSSLFDDWLSSYGSDTSIIMFLCSICSINTLRDSYSRVSRLNYNMNFLYYLEFFLESTKENLSFYSLSYNFYLNFLVQVKVILQKLVKFLFSFIFLNGKGNVDLMEWQESQLKERVFPVFS